MRIKRDLWRYKDKKNLKKKGKLQNLQNKKINLKSFEETKKTKNLEKNKQNVND